MAMKTKSGWIFPMRAPCQAVGRGYFSAKVGCVDAGQCALFVGLEGDYHDAVCSSKATIDFGSVGSLIIFFR